MIAIEVPKLNEVDLKIIIPVKLPILNIKGKKVGVASNITVNPSKPTEVKFKVNLKGKWNRRGMKDEFQFKYEMEWKGNQLDHVQLRFVQRF